MFPAMRLQQELQQAVVVLLHRADALAVAEHGAFGTVQRAAAKVTEPVRPRWFRKVLIFWGVIGCGAGFAREDARPPRRS